MNGGLVSHQVALAAVCVLLGVAVLDIGLAAAWLVHDLMRECERPWFSRTWSLLHAWFALQGAVVVVNLAALPFVLPMALGRSAGVPVVALLGLTVFQNVVFVAVAAVLIFAVYRADRSTVGLAWLPTWKQLRTGLVGGVLLCGLGGGLQWVSERALHAVLSPAHFRALSEFSNMTSLEAFVPKAEVLASRWTFGAVLLVVAVAAPLGEEFMFRAFLHRAARRRLGAFWGTAVSALAFAAAHAGPLQILAILPMGILLAVAYDRTRSLWVPITMHAVNNAAGVFALYYIPGMN